MRCHRLVNMCVEKVGFGWLKDAPTYEINICWHYLCKSNKQSYELTRTFNLMDIICWAHSPWMNWISMTSSAFDNAYTDFFGTFSKGFILMWSWIIFRTFDLMYTKTNFLYLLFFLVILFFFSFNEMFTCVAVIWCNDNVWKTGFRWMGILLGWC